MTVPNNLDLDAIRARAAAATPAPWYWGPEHPEFSDVLNEETFAVSPEAPLMEFEPDRNGAADAEFVAYARQDVPALIDALGRAYAVIRQNAITQATQERRLAEANRIVEAARTWRRDVDPRYGEASAEALCAMVDELNRVTTRPNVIKDGDV